MDDSHLPRSWYFRVKPKYRPKPTLPCGALIASIRHSVTYLSEQTGSARNEKAKTAVRLASVARTSRPKPISANRGQQCTSQKIEKPLDCCGVIPAPRSSRGRTNFAAGVAQASVRETPA